MSETKDKIIKAARQLFETNGFAATTTKQIAQSAGVSEVTLFRHFETKRNLFEQTVHSCMHPYKLRDYLENDVQYNLEKDLKVIANNMMQTYKQNLPLMRMVFKDKMKGSKSEMNLRKHEHGARGRLIEYFEQMHKMGYLKADPKMALMFFMNNITGYFMKFTFSLDENNINKEYFDWIIDRVIFALKN